MKNNQRWIPDKKKRLKRPWEPWTPDEVEKLLDLHERGFLYKRIAEELGRNRGAIKRKIAVLRVSNRQSAWSDEEIERLRDCLDKGMQVTEIAERLGRSAESVQGKKRHMGLSKKRSDVRRNAAKCALIIKLYDSGETLNQIAERFDVHTATISHILKDNGYETKWSRSKHYYPQHHCRWHAYEVVKLRRLLARGASWEEIYQRFSMRTPRALRAKSSKIKRFWKVKDPAELRREHEEVRQRNIEARQKQVNKWTALNTRNFFS